MSQVVWTRVRSEVDLERQGAVREGLSCWLTHWLTSCSYSVSICYLSQYIYLYIDISFIVAIYIYIYTHCTCEEKRLTHSLWHLCFLSVITALSSCHHLIVHVTLWFTCGVSCLLSSRERPTPLSSFPLFLMSAFHLPSNQARPLETEISNWRRALPQRLHLHLAWSTWKLS